MGLLISLVSVWIGRNRWQVAILLAIAAYTPLCVMELLGTQPRPALAQGVLAVVVCDLSLAMETAMFFVLWALAKANLFRGD